MARLRTRLCRLLSPLVYLAALASGAFACPLRGGLVDFDCDANARVVIIGDSFVSGTLGDGRSSDGGYVVRTARGLPGVLVFGVGYPGITSAKLLSKVKQAVTRRGNGPLSLALSNADYVVIDVGRNDYFSKTKASTVAKNVTKMANLIALHGGRATGVPPLVTVATLAGTRRPKQQRFIDSVNSALVGAARRGLPVFLRPDALSGIAVGRDGLHPTATGYDRLASALVDYLLGVNQQRALWYRHDFDSDYIYDEVEAIRFGTSPAATDTDGDGIADGYEVFFLATNPLIPN